MAEQERPNVIWVFGDQHRGQALGCHGDPNLHTPNLDQMASQGIDYEQAVCGFPLCCPFRGSLLTSRYPHNCVPGHEYRLPPEQPTVAQVFNHAGYDTVYLGKWHLDGFLERTGRAALHIVPPERRGGFQEWLGYENNNSPWDSWVHGRVPVWTQRCGDKTGEECHYRLPGYETDELGNLLIDYLEHAGKLRREGKNRPFFAVLSVQPPHDPFEAPTEFMARHTPGGVKLRPNVPPVAGVEQRCRRELAGYYAQIENLDANLGRIRQAVSRAGLGEDTHILFFSDHGEMSGSHGQYRKTSPYEESIRVPFLIGGAPEMDRYRYRSWNSRSVINHVDIAPTSLGLCGISVPDWMEGTDYSGQRRKAPEAEYPASTYIQSVLPTGHHDSIEQPWRGVITEDGWKYVCFEGQAWLLFNLNDDPYELVNLAHNTRFGAEKRRLQQLLAEWIHRTGDTFRLPELRP